MTLAVVSPPKTSTARDNAAVSPSALQSRLLAERVRQCVPLRHPAFGKLLQLLSIEASDTVPTAAVTVGTRSRLLINPAFVAERCRTDAHLAMLVMHELYHVLLGHTRIYRRPTLAANWAFDCIINAQLCRLHPGVEFTSFFSGLAATDGPWSLIAPPPGWPNSPRYAAGALGDVHRRLYDDAGATTAELFALLDRMAFTLDIEGTDRLLGNHAHDAEEVDPLHADPELMAEVRRIVARWPMIERRGGADDGAVATHERSDLRRHTAARHAICNLLRNTAFAPDGGVPVRSMVETAAPTPLPHAADRRAQLQRLMGSQPLLWHGSLLHAGWQPVGQVAVYLDVSGSMAPCLPVLLDALKETAALVRWPIYGFSTEVYPITRAELAAGRFRSTGGTHIACVAQHLIHTGLSRAVVITDGDVQEIPAALASRLRRVRPRVRVGLLNGGNGRFCDCLGWPATRIPALDS